VAKQHIVGDSGPLAKSVHKRSETPVYYNPPSIEQGLPCTPTMAERKSSPMPWRRYPELSTPIPKSPQDVVWTENQLPACAPDVGLYQHATLEVHHRVRTHMSPHAGALAGVQWQVAKMEAGESFFQSHAAHGGEESPILIAHHAENCARARHWERAEVVSAKGLEILGPYPRSEVQKLRFKRQNKVYDSATAARLWHVRGRAGMARHQRSVAVPCFEEAVELDPLLAESWVGLGLCLKEKAIEQLQELRPLYDDILARWDKADLQEKAAGLAKEKEKTQDAIQSAKATLCEAEQKCMRAVELKGKGVTA